MSKICFKCNVEKDIGSFYKHSRMKDGHLNKCIDCTKADVRLHRNENDSVRKYDRERYHKNPDRKKQAAKTSKRWAKQYPERRRAQAAVYRAVRDGRIHRGPCEVCGQTPAHGHHEDYTKPLDVIWLCASHHQIRHSQLDKATAI
jgi:hypothetical protein